MMSSTPLPPAPATNIDLSFISAMLATLSDPAASSFWARCRRLD
jgi:hypothetical protein